MTDMRVDKFMQDFGESDSRKIRPEGVYRRMLECHSCPLYEGDIKRIANAFGLGYGSMLTFIKQHGLDYRLEDEVMKKVDYEKVQSLYNSGKTDAQITKELDISFSTVHMWRERHGFPKNEPAAAADTGILIVGNEKQTKRPSSDEIAAAIQAKNAKKPVKQAAKINIDFDAALPKLKKPVKAPKPAPVPEKVMVASEEITAGAITQSMGTRPTDLFVEMQQMVEAYQDDIDELLHGWYLYFSRTCMLWPLPAQAEDMKNDIEELRLSWCADSLMLTRLETDIERLKQECKLMFAMLLGAGVTDVRAMLKEVIG